MKRSRSSFFALTAVVMLAAGCGTLRAPIQTTGPVVSREGIELSVTRQLCTQIQEADFPGADLVETILEIAIRNPTPEPIAVRRDAFRLLAPDGSALRTVTWRAADPLVVGRRTIGVFRLRYMSRGTIECAKTMDLDADAGLTVRGAPVKVGRVQFIPSRAT